MKKIVLIGGGGHSKVIIDIINSTKEYEIVGLTEKNSDVKSILDIPILGDDSILEELFNKGIEYAFISIGISEGRKLRNILYNKVKKIGYKCPTLIHKQAIISSYSEIREGTCVMAGAIINPNTTIGINSVINTGVIIEHDCFIGNNIFVSPGSILAGGITVKDNSFIGMGSKILEGRIIGSNVTIGAGAVVTNDIPDNSVAVGVPAKVIKVKEKHNES